MFSDFEKIFDVMSDEMTHSISKYSSAAVKRTRLHLAHHALNHLERLAFLNPQRHGRTANLGSC
jgi:hypothetical protein